MKANFIRNLANALDTWPTSTFKELQKTKYVIKKKINKEISEIIGAFIGDGYIGAYGPTKTKYVVGFVGDKHLDIYYITYLTSLIKKNFQYTTPKIRFRSNENTMDLRIFSKKFYDFFISLGFVPGIKSHNVSIQNIILCNKHVTYTIRGIFDTDDCVFYDKRAIYKKPYPRITLQIRSKRLIKQLEKYLSAKDFKIYVKHYSHRSYLEIYGQKQLERFLKRVGFSNPRHLNKIRLLGLVV